MPPQTVPVVPVFVSSTWLDLGREREAVRDAVLRMKLTQFVGMEYFGSRDETTRGASLEEVDRSLVYVGVFGARYGSGITEAEYRRARERGLPCFIYFKDDAAAAEDLRDTDAAQAAKLEALREELRREHIVTTFRNPDDLAARVTADLHRWLFDEYLPKLPAPPARTLHQLRAPVGDFVGREREISELLAALRSGGDGAGAPVCGISGMGGVGKTELALYVADGLRGVYPDAQLVLDMRGTDATPREPSDALAACIRAFHGPETRLPDDAEELTRLYRSTLEGRRALILLDNAHGGAQVRPLLPPAGSALLVTSRETVALPGMKARVTLDQLGPEEARELLKGIAPHVPADAADRICGLCGHLPLAIRAAGSLLAVTVDLEPDTYVAQLRDERTRLEQIGAEGVDVSVEASFNLSYARLADDAARVFRRLAVFPASFDAAAEEAVCEDEKHERLTALLRRNLVSYSAATRRYRLHDLARLFADSRMNEGERIMTGMRHSAHYAGVLRLAHELYKQGGEGVTRGLTLLDLEWRNFQAGQAWAEVKSDEYETAMELCGDYPDAGTHLLALRQHPRERMAWLEAALAAARGLNDRAAEGVHLDNLALVHADMGETRRAIECHERALIIYRELGGRRGVMGALSNLGLAYDHLGETRRAVEYYEQSLIVARELGDLSGEGGVLGNLGMAYGKMGETQRAVEFTERYMAIARELGDRRGESIALSNLGTAYANRGETQRAAEFFEQSLAIARELGDRLSEARALLNGGIMYGMLGNRAGAVARIGAALEIFERIESPYAENARAALAFWPDDATKEE
ncbi:MAG TPA: tetratricopeptide repeat protein [Pyrinomonadaceae bacterium]|jgi:tetratricopeptide (TPR) repeat protein|nr:tetratricopeptide repeat protein [Pyrinomonadaceae bacterium]